MRRLAFALSISICMSLAFAVAFPSAAQAPAAALSGLVSSVDETAMEGVVVSATRAGSNITVRLQRTITSRPAPRPPLTSM